MSTTWPLSAEAAEGYVSPRAGMAKRATDRAPEQPRANAGAVDQRVRQAQSTPSTGTDPAPSTEHAEHAEHQYDWAPSNEVGKCWNGLLKINKTV